MYTIHTYNTKFKFTSSCPIKDAPEVVTSNCFIMIAYTYIIICR